MRTRILIAVLLGVLISCGTNNAGASGDDEDQICTEVISMYSTTIKCEYTAQSIAEARAGEPDANWRVYQLCKDGTSGEAEPCANPRACTSGTKTGTLYVVFKNGERMGVACLTDGEAGEVGDPPIRVLVLKAFETLDWPESELVVEPPGGRTLVNLETNFYTENTDVTVNPVTVLGHSVLVRAEPISYSWHFGDGAKEVTTSPGAPYPKLDVFHIYAQVDEVKVSVETTYGNPSYSIDGADWVSFDATRTIPGAESELEILEAKPQLVIR